MKQLEDWYIKNFRILDEKNTEDFRSRFFSISAIEKKAEL